MEPFIIQHPFSSLGQIPCPAQRSLSVGGVRQEKGSVPRLGFPDVHQPCREQPNSCCPPGNQFLREYAMILMHLGNSRHKCRIPTFTWWNKHRFKNIPFGIQHLQYPSVGYKMLKVKSQFVWAKSTSLKFCQLILVVIWSMWTSKEMLIAFCSICDIRET